MNAPREAHRASALLALATGLAVALAFAALAAPASPGASEGPRYVAGDDTLHPRLRFTDSLVSKNDRCIVTGRKLNPRMAPMYVNGAPIGFC